MEKERDAQEKRDREEIEKAWKAVEAQERAEAQKLRLEEAKKPKEVVQKPTKTKEEIEEEKAIKKKSYGGGGLNMAKYNALMAALGEERVQKSRGGTRSKGRRIRF